MLAHRSRHASFVYLSIFLAGIVLLTPTRSEAQTTALFLDSQPGDTVGFGGQKLFLPSTGSVFTIQQNTTHEVTIRINGPESAFWFLNFNAPNSLPLQVGTYNGATRYPFTPFAGMAVSGGSGCNDLTGRFVVRELVYAGAVIQRLAIDFEQHCEDLDPALFGAIRYNSTIASLTPFDGAYPVTRLDISPTANGRVSGSGIDCQGTGPVCSLALTSAATVTLTATPDPGFTFAGWTGTCHGGLTVTMKVNMIEPCAALFLPLNAPGTTSVMLNSQRGEYLVQGAREVYNTQNSVWSAVSASVSGNLITGVTATVTSIGDKDASYLTYQFRAPSGQSLVPGT